MDKTPIQTHFLHFGQILDGCLEMSIILMATANNCNDT